MLGITSGNRKKVVVLIAWIALVAIISSVNSAPAQREFNPNSSANVEALRELIREILYTRNIAQSSDIAGLSNR